MKIVLGFGRTFSEIVTTLQKLQADWSDDRPAKEIRRSAIIELESVIQAILELSKQRYSISFYMATLFIIR